MYPALIFVHGESFFAKLIRLAQRVRFTGSDKRFTYWNHVAVLVGYEKGNGVVIEALSRGIVKRSMAEWDRSKDFLIVPLDATEWDRREMLAFVEHEVGQKYGWLKALSAGLNLLTGGKLAFGLDGTEICSGLAARMMERATWWFEDPTDVSPAGLAKRLNAGG